MKILMKKNSLKLIDNDKDKNNQTDKRYYKYFFIYEKKINY
jgi:hypothetical protein